MLAPVRQILLQDLALWLCREKEHVYGKLAPQAVNSTLLAEDGEANFTTKDKKNPSDFALWKAAKPGEPSWPSPKCAQDAAGRGRPGQAAAVLSYPHNVTAKLSSLKNLV